ncbi:hypothetical protein GIW81_16710 [Hyphomicrobium sp. xq]|uniref:Uncharacterized protein n=1 Tax=Hyphomicrobium album TaxID=2665159 RepID=A0A6I3KQ85_9HYPH|nr:hypothetical protein [Hyphomicrobium album]MTD95982.1 hypothetical protein [Hyphomicrobium album]
MTTGATMMRRLFNRVLRRGRSPRELFVHEDDWGQIEVLPAACAAWCEAEIARIDHFARDHASPDGTGWTDMYVRSVAPVPLESVRIPFDAAADVIGARLPAFEIVSSGTLSSPEPVPHVRGFGPAANTGAVLVGDKTRAHVAMIALVMNGSRGELDALLAALAQLPFSATLLIVDWPRGHVVPLGDRNAIARYADA